MFHLNSGLNYERIVNHTVVYTMKCHSVVLHSLDASETDCQGTLDTITDYTQSHAMYNILSHLIYTIYIISRQLSLTFDILATQL